MSRIGEQWKLEKSSSATVWIAIDFVHSGELHQAKQRENNGRKRSGAKTRLGGNKARTIES